MYHSILLAKIIRGSGVSVLTALLATTLIAPRPAHANGPSLNGASGPRPFYVFGHNPNSPQNIHDDLVDGVNALEPDITFIAGNCLDNFADNPLSLTTCDSDNPFDDCDAACDTNNMAGDNSTLLFWLTDLHTKVLAAQTNAAGNDPLYNNIVFIAFDSKGPVHVAQGNTTFSETTAAPGEGNAINLLNVIRKYLNNGLPRPINFVISAPDAPGGKVFFKGFKPFDPQDPNPADPTHTLRANEAIGIDSEPNVDTALNMFRKPPPAGLGYDSKMKLAFGAGGGTWTTYDEITGTAPGLEQRIAKAAFRRAERGAPSVIAYAYLVDGNCTEAVNRFIDVGVDGIISDDTWLSGVKPIVDGRSDVFYAAWNSPHNTPDYLYNGIFNPFTGPPPEAYGLRIHTGTDADAGTNADLTFHLNNGTDDSSKLVETDTFFGGFGCGLTTLDTQMENGDDDYVAISSKDLGSLMTVSIKNGGGFQSGWELSKFEVYSARWLGNNDCPSYYNVVADLHAGKKDGDFIDGSTTRPFPLTVHLTAVMADIACLPDQTVSTDLGTCTALVPNLTPTSSRCPGSLTYMLTGATVDNGVDDASGTAFNKGTTTVTYTLVDNFDPPHTATCSFKVTVVDNEKPAIKNCPGPQVVNATSPSGATITFAPPTATDNCSVASVVSVPASGSIFPIGDTTVLSTATDNSNNQSTCSVTMHVKGAAEQISDLNGSINGVPVNTKTKKLLAAYLNAALKEITNQSVPCGELQAFIFKVQSLPPKKLSAAQATQLINKAKQILAVLGCP